MDALGHEFQCRNIRFFQRVRMDEDGLENGLALCGESLGLESFVHVCLSFSIKKGTTFDSE